MAKAKLKIKRDVLLPDISSIKDPSVKAVLEKILKVIDEEHTDIYEDLNSINNNLP